MEKFAPAKCVIIDKPFYICLNLISSTFQSLTQTTQLDGGSRSAMGVAGGESPCRGVLRHKSGRARSHEARGGFRLTSVYLYAR